jgi:hypothetical protein
VVSVVEELKRLKRVLWVRSRIYGFMGLANVPLYDKVIRVLESYIKKREGGEK